MIDITPLSVDEYIDESFEKINTNDQNLANGVNVNESAIAALETGDSNALIGVYKTVDAVNTNDYAVTYSGLTLFDELRLNVEVYNQNTSGVTVNLNALGVKEVVILEDNVEYPVPNGKMIGINNLQYDLSRDKFVLLTTIDKSVRMSGGGLLINGNFDIWQRGTSFPGIIGNYTVDRWKSGINAAGAYDVDRIVNTEDSVNSKFLLKITPIGITVNLFQKIEQPAHVIKGKKTTFSFKAKASAAYSTVIRLQGSVTGLKQSLSIDFTADYNKVTVTFDAVTDFNDDEDVMLMILEVKEITLFANMKYEVGDIATDFIPKTYAEELRDCQRYYEKSYSDNVSPFTATVEGAITETSARNSDNFSPGIRFKVEKRIPPTVILHSVNTGNGGVVDNSGDKSATASNVGTGGFRQIAITAGVAASGLNYHYTADAEL